MRQAKRKGREMAKDIEFAIELNEGDSFKLSAIVNGKLIQRTYYGDNIKTAKRQFIARFINA